MDKIWVLVTYNDEEIERFKIQGVFSSKDLAEEEFDKIKLSSNHTHREITEFEIIKPS